MLFHSAVSVVLKPFRIDLLNDIKLYNDNDIKIGPYTEVASRFEKNGDVSGYWIMFNILKTDGVVIAEMDITVDHNMIWSIQYCSHLQ